MTDLAKESLPQGGAAKAAVESALRVAQMVWGMHLAQRRADGAPHTESMPSLNEDEIDEIAMRADRIFRQIIAGERTALTALTAANNVSRFRKQKKRGAKVRTGPCAAILTFPARSAPDQLAGETLLSEWAWIRSNHGDWDDEELSGGCKKEKWQKLFYEQAASAAIDGHAMPDGDAIRQEIAKCRAIIEKRIRVKDWLETRGVNWDEVKNPEQALFFIFDRLQAAELPSIA